jgi:hypothetical protein
MGQSLNLFSCLKTLKCFVIFLRFKDKQKLPENLECVKALHEDIQIARVPRQCAKKIQYAYLEFGTEAKLEVAKVTILNSLSIYWKICADKQKCCSLSSIQVLSKLTYISAINGKEC